MLGYWGPVNGLTDRGTFLRRILASMVVVAALALSLLAETARAEGLRVGAMAQEFTGDGLVATLVNWFAHPSLGR